MNQQDTGVCIRHLKHVPCLGKHQRYDGEVCHITKNKTASVIVRKLHGGILTEPEARESINQLGLRPKVLDNTGVIV